MESKATYEVTPIVKDWDREGWYIDSKSSADWALDKIREAMEEKAKAQAIADEIIARKQEEVNAWLATECSKHDSSINFFRVRLEEWTAKELESLNANKKKPVHNISLPCGKVGFKKQKDKYFVGGEPCSKDSKHLLDLMKASNSEYVNTETIETVNWADFKKTLTVENGKVISADGEVLAIDVVEGDYEFTLPKF